ncbi:MAG: DUF1345 domain-containing protein [Acetobacteraceae bacterium]|nr:DUF1345 domain-containing protein [Acetobacteraceae bacterium]
MRLIRRVIIGHKRLFTAVLAGIIAAGLLPGTLQPPTRAILAWDIGVTVFLMLVGIMFAREPLSRIQQDAAQQKEGEWTIFWLTLAGIIFSFAVIINDFSGIKDLPRTEKELHIGLVAGTLLLSWFMTQTSFALRYAHEYYEVGPGQAEIERGLQFPEEDRPDYLDFMYFALVLGMTFQVSDVQITSRKFRRVAAVHGLISFLFNTIIVALTVNLAAGLL